MKSLFLIPLLLCALATNGRSQSVRYYRHVHIDGHCGLKFSYEITGPDTGKAHCYRCTYDAAKRLVLWQYINHRRMISDPEFGLAQVKITYDESGELRTFLNRMGKPAKGVNGEYAQRYEDQPSKNTRLEWGYDRRGDIIESDEDGCSGYSYQLDKAGDGVRVFCLDKHARKISDVEGRQEFRFKYDQNDLEIEVSNYDSVGQLLKTGVATIKTVRDAQGGTITQSRFDCKGKPTSTADLAAIYKLGHDRFGNATENSSYSDDDTFMGKTVEVYDSLGSVLTKKVYGADNQVLATKGWYQWEYDSLGQDTRVTTFSRDGSFESAFIYKYDDRGNCLVCSEIDKDRVIIDNDLGYASAYMKYDDNDNEVEYYFVNARGVPCIRKSDGVARIVVEYNSLGLSTALRYQDMSGQPVASSDQDDHAATITGSYDKWGVSISQERYDAKGNPIVAPSNSGEK